MGKFFKFYILIFPLSLLICLLTLYFIIPNLLINNSFLIHKIKNLQQKNLPQLQISLKDITWARLPLLHLYGITIQSLPNQDYWLKNVKITELKLLLPPETFTSGNIPFNKHNYLLIQAFLRSNYVYLKQLSLYNLYLKLQINPLSFFYAKENYPHTLFFSIKKLKKQNFLLEEIVGNLSIKHNSFQNLQGKGNFLWKNSIFSYFIHNSAENLNLILETKHTNIETWFPANTLSLSGSFKGQLQLKIKDHNLEYLLGILESTNNGSILKINFQEQLKSLSLPEIVINQLSERLNNYHYKYGLITFTLENNEIVAYFDFKGIKNGDDFNMAIPLGKAQDFLQLLYN